jgi:hypothetical protein
MLGVYLQYAQREAAHDASRLLGAVVLLALGLMILGCGLLVGHAALVAYLVDARGLGLLSALGAVAAGDAVLGLALALGGRQCLRRPLLVETRSLVRRTVESFADVRE